MKNIYIEDAPDEKDPYLFTDYKNNIYTLPQIMETYGKVLPGFNPINLFVVSLSEKIASNDWAYEVNSCYPTGLPRLLKCESVWGDEMRVPGGWTRRIKFPQSGLEMAKVVLTTDSKLIDDGVWSVDDDFIDWFIKERKDYIELYKDNQCTYCGQRNCDNLRCRGYANESVFIPLLPHKITKSVTTMYEDIVLKQEHIDEDNKIIVIPRNIPDNLYVLIEEAKNKRYGGIFEQTDKQIDFCHGQCDTIEIIEEWLRSL